MKRQKKGEPHRCAHCCQENATTGDHVPPKNLFPKEFQHEVPEVPACLECNRGSSADDEYFRLMLIMRADVSENPAVKEVVDTAFRSLERVQARRFATGFRKNFRMRDLLTPSGIFVGQKPGYQVDPERMRRVVERTVSGLYLHETGQCLPAEKELAILDAQSADAFSPDQLAALGEFLSRQSFTHRSIAGGLFRYSFCTFPEDPCLSHWSLRFYGSVSYHCATRHKRP